MRAAIDEIFLVHPPLAFDEDDGFDDTAMEMEEDLMLEVEPTFSLIPSSSNRVSIFIFSTLFWIVYCLFFILLF